MSNQEPASPDLTGPNPPNAFLNIPYDDKFEALYLAYIAGIAAYGLTPRATLEVPGGARRLDRIFELIRTCRYSFHDLSRVELDPLRPPTPRFNMPFELGLVVAWEKLHPGEHVWFVFESKKRRLLKSLSDRMLMYMAVGHEAFFGSSPMLWFARNAGQRWERWPKSTVHSIRICLRLGSARERDQRSNPGYSRNWLSQHMQ